MPLKLYKCDPTPPSQAAMMVLEALGLEVEYVDVELGNGDNYSQEYIKLNPMHTVPFLQDGDFYLNDSHAIAAYLVSAYGKDDSFYPKDLQKRATVDQRLHFDNGILYTRMRAIFDKLRSGVKESEMSGTRDTIVDGYGILETYLGQNEWLAGDHMTVADLCAVSSLAASNIVQPLDRNKFPKTSAWWDRLAALPFYKARCAPNVLLLKDYYMGLVATNNASLSSVNNI